MSRIRDSIGKESRERQENNIFDFIKESDIFKDYDDIYLYVSFRSEFPTKRLFDFFRDEGKRVMLPKIEDCEDTSSPNKKEMNFYPVYSMSELKKGYMGILEPESDVLKKNNTACTAQNRAAERKPGILFENTMKIMLLPGLAFDKCGGRLGYGGGFYDAFLKKAQDNDIKIKTVGLCFNEQIIQEVPVEEKDCRVRGILSENLRIL